MERDGDELIQDAIEVTKAVKLDELYFSLFDFITGRCSFNHLTFIHSFNSCFDQTCFRKANWIQCHLKWFPNLKHNV